MAIQQLVEDLGIFLDTLAGQAHAQKAQLRPKFAGGMTIMDVKLGGISLTGKEDEAYRILVREFTEQLAPQVSERSITKAINEAMLTFTKFAKLNDQVNWPTERKMTLAKVRAELCKLPSIWISCVPIYGLTPPTASWNLGHIQVVGSRSAEMSEVLAQADNVADQSLDEEAHKTANKESLRRRLSIEDGKRVYALVKTKACDATAAWGIAKGDAERMTDCLNFMVDFQDGSTSLTRITMTHPPSTPVRSGLTFALQAGDSFVAQDEVSSPPGTLNSDEFHDDVANHPWLSNLWQILSNESRSKHQQRILSAVHWSGRAATRSRSDEKFLLRAISLESLILGADSQGELTFRLSHSIVHLLGNQFTSRLDGVRKIVRLYGVRSKIVHSGNATVSPEDDALLREICIRAIGCLLHKKVFLAMHGAEELDGWLRGAMAGEVGTEKKSGNVGDA